MESIGKLSTRGVDEIDFQTCAWNGSELLAVGEGGGVYSSADGTDWDTVFPGALTHLAWTGSQFLVISSRSIYSSPDLSVSSWSALTSGSEPSNDVVETPLGFFAPGDGGQLLKSADGVMWSRVDPVPWRTLRLNRLVWTGSYLVMVGQDMVARSIDGTNWTMFPLSYFFTDAVFTGTRTVAVGVSGGFAWSTNGITWNEGTIPGAPHMRAVAEGAGTIVAVGDGGKIFTSTTGAAWTERASGTTVHLKQVEYFGSRFVAAGNGGVILTSPDGVSWTPRDFGSPFSCLDLDVVGSEIIALCGGNTIRRSSDGITWAREALGIVGNSEVLLWNGSSFLSAGFRPYTSPDGRSWTSGDLGLAFPVDALDVTWDGTRYTAVDDEGEIRSSTDGLSWTAVPNPTPAKLTGVASSFAGTVAVGWSGTILHSPDGLAWTNVTPQRSGLDFHMVEWIGDRFVAGAPDLTAFSFDGINWSAMTPGDLNDVAEGGGTFVAVGDHGRILSSADGSQWEERISGTLLHLNGVDYANGRWFACGDRGTLLRSINGIDWLPANSGIGNYGIESVSWGGSMYVAGTGSRTYFLSSDGAKWIQHESPGRLNMVDPALGGGFEAFSIGLGGYNYPESPDGLAWTRRHSHSKLTGAVHGGGLIVATTGSGELVTSPDGVNWTTRDTPSHEWMQSVAWTGTMFVAVGHGQTVLTSSDGIVWTEVTTSGLNSQRIDFVIWTGTRLVLTGSGRVHYSTDAINWTESPASTSFDTMAWSGSLLVGVGSSGQILTSPDGIVWTNRVSGTSANLWSVTWTGSFFVVVGSFGTILTSSDGITWTNRATPVTFPLFGVASIGQFVVAAGTDDRVLVSNTHGQSWLVRDSGIDGAAYDFVIAANGQIYALGFGGTIVSTEDGVDWTVRRRGLRSVVLPKLEVDGWQWWLGRGRVYRSQDPEFLWPPHGEAIEFSASGFHHSGSSFVITGARGEITTSRDGSDWTAQQSPTSNSLLRLASNANRVVAVGPLDTIVSSPNPPSLENNYEGWRCTRNLPPGEDDPLDTPHPWGVNNLMAYALDLPFSFEEGPLGEILPRALDESPGLRFGLPVATRTDIVYVIEASTTMRSGEWIELARKEPGQGWVGAVKVQSQPLADEWTAFEIVDLADPLPDERYYRLRVAAP